MIFIAKLHTARKARPLRLPAFFSFLFSFFFCTGCVSLVEKAGQALDGSAFAEKKLAVYWSVGMELREMQNKAGERSFIIKLNRFPAIQFRGSAPNELGEFNLVSLDYLGGSSHGWNEFRLDISGEGRLAQDETTVALCVQEIETIQISFARIKRYDTRLSGNEALAGLRNRHERIKAIAGWMNEREDAPKGLDVKNFEKYWKPLLFPETVSKKKRPSGWQLENDQWNRADSINWNKSYTERLFPEELREIRNSATMLRDWEEALDWLYTEYEWDRIQETLARETVFTRKKK
ncbi:MAG: hypothetical protein LBU85_08620 [Treponema sp.]|jgi:hypothetical protein|nr:hypothetical protein [Treponema sp.]